jgi:uncharacterized protein
MAKNGFRVFDSDMHIMEPPDLWERYIDDEFKAMAPKGLVSNNVRDLRVAFPNTPQRRGTTTAQDGGRNFDRNQATYRNHSERGWTADCQLEAMEVEGIDVATLFPTRGLSVLLHPDLDRRFAAAIARAYNNWLADFCAADPSRLFGAGMISVRSVEDAVEETYRCVEDLKFRTVFLRSNFGDLPPWHDPAYEPLWDALEKLEIPLGFHEASGSSITGSQFDPNFGLRRVYGQPMGQMLGMGHFLGGGILARHPKLKVAFLEANCSWLPWLLWRMDEGYEREGDVAMPDLTMAPSEYYKRQCWVSVEPDETPARHVIEDWGADNIVFSTDYPHGDSKYPDAVNAFMELPFSDEAKRKILWDNCARLYAVAEPAAV